MVRLAKTYIWWEPPAETLARPVRLVAQVMDLGTWDDCLALGRCFGKTMMRAALKNAQPGWFRPRSWTYWHYRLGLTPWESDPPAMPIRNFDALKIRTTA